ncbi:MAG: NUDIX domain-containing protein [Dehalococcoidia bacterium]
MTSGETNSLRTSNRVPVPEGFRGDTGAPAAPRFCNRCGAGLEARYHPPDGCSRLLCVGCGHVQYRNPIVVGAAIVEREGEVLLLRRARPPQAGAWVFPGGFVELGETVAGAAARECVEETGIEPHIATLLGVYDRPGPGVVIVVFRATVASGTARPGVEASEIRWFGPEDIPWAELAFDTTEAALHDWFNAVASLRA